MVSYYNSLAMYRHQEQNSQFSPATTASWYPQPSQQYLPTCTGDVESCVVSHLASGDTHKYFTPHHTVYTPEWPQNCYHVQEVSPTNSEVSSPGAEGVIPSGPPVSKHNRPQPARSPYEWMRKNSYQTQPTPGRTRTRDKYRVVYTDHQRLELEKEFHYSRYITIRRKAELASSLGLSERQVKIWFQNRRAKERKQMKKKEESAQQKIKRETADMLSGCITTAPPQPPIEFELNPPVHNMQNGGGTVGLQGGVALL